MYLVCLFGSASVAHGAGQSATPSSIPVYPGAEQYTLQAEPPGASVQETLMGRPGELPMLTSSRETYIAAVPPEKVAAYYQSALGGVASGFAMWKGVDPRTLAPGRATAVHRQRYVAGGTNQFVYHWYRKEANGDIVLLELEFSSSFDPRNLDRPGPLTEIRATTKTYSTRAAAESPGEADLGAPVYAGALYDSHESRVMGGGLFVHVFLTSDPVAAVVAFYEARLGRTALKGEPPAGGVSWYFRGYSSLSDDDVLTIQEEQGKGAAYRTRVDFRLDRIK